MDWASWFLLIVGGIYWLFNIKKIYHFFVWSFLENGVFFTSGILLLAVIFLSGIFFAFVAPQYGWITQRAFIWYIVAFIVYRLIFGVRNKEGS